MAHQYKVGDKVRIKKREDYCDLYPFPFEESMNKLAGTICEIKAIKSVESFTNSNSKYIDDDYHMYEIRPVDSSDRRDFVWAWHSSMFEPVEELGNPVITPLLTQANLGDSVKILHLNGYISKNSKGHYFIRFSEENHIHGEIAWHFYKPEFKELAIDFNAVPGYKLSPHFKSIMSLLAFVNEVNLRYKSKESIEQSTITPKTLNENEIKFQKPKAAFSRGSVPKGNPICGRKHKTAIVVGRLSNQEISC